MQSVQTTPSPAHLAATATLADATGHSLTLSQVMHQFGSFMALKDINLEIQPGEFVSLLGPSGCGKTTLLRIISGFLDPTAGNVLIDGKSVPNSLAMRSTSKPSPIPFGWGFRSPSPA